MQDHITNHPVFLQPQLIADDAMLRGTVSRPKGSEGGGGRGGDDGGERGTVCPALPGATRLGRCHQTSNAASGERARASTSSRMTRRILVELEQGQSGV